MKWLIGIVLSLSVCLVYANEDFMDSEPVNLENSFLFSNGSSAQCPQGYQRLENGQCVFMAQPMAQKPPVQNACFEVRGVQALKGVDEKFARKMAIRDALEQATMRQNLSVRTDQTVEDFVLTKQSGRFTAQSKVKNFKILREDIIDQFMATGEEATPKLGQLQASNEDKYFEVILKVCLTDDPNACPNLDGNLYQPRVAIAPVTIVHPQEANDISNLLNGYRLELDRRLRSLKFRNATLLNEAVDLMPNVEVTPNLEIKRLEDVRNKTGAQYLMLSVIRSAGASIEDNGYVNQARRFYNLRVDNDSRYIEVDWYLIDLLEYSIAHENRTGFDVKGQVDVGRDRPFGTNAFFATDVGMVFNTVLNQQVQDVHGYLKCQPFVSEVIDIRNDEYILFLNSESGAKVGDELAVYHRVGRGVQFNGLDLGMDYKPGAFLRIKRILPRFAVAEVMSKKEVIQVGDRVKTW